LWAVKAGGTDRLGFKELKICGLWNRCLQSLIFKLNLLVDVLVVLDVSSCQEDIWIIRLR
jgi:hypothetical protein